MNSHDDFELKSKEILSVARVSHFQASPFLATRVLAHIDSNPKRSFWHPFSWAAGGMLVGGFLTLFSYQIWQAKFANQEGNLVAMDYVIHMDFDNQLDGQELENKYAEVELPDGVEFVSKAHPEVRKLRKMKLSIPTTNSSNGKRRLPFVVRAANVGEKSILVRILNDKGHLVREKKISVKFQDERPKL